jgi:hypothetical protein
MKVVWFQDFERSQSVDGKDYPERELVDPFCFVLKSTTEYWYCEIQAGYVWDGASIPRAFWSIIGGPFSGDYIIAALVHDLLYDTHITTRAEADDLFQQIMLLSGVTTWRRSLMYRAVKWFGGKPWIKSDAHINIFRKFILVDRVPIAKSGNANFDNTGGRNA